MDTTESPKKKKKTGTFRKFTRTAGIMGAGALTGAAAYWFLGRKRLNTWGATYEETERLLPGDEYILQPKLRATRAVNIHARPSEVWPWLVQIGQGRGGFYSYDWLENLFGFNIHSANRIVPELQHLKEGDTISLEPGGLGLTVQKIDKNKTLILRWCFDTKAKQAVDIDGPKPEEYVEGTWVFHLEELDKKSTRLISRIRIDWTSGFQNSVFNRVFIEPADFVMERKMLLGIKKRAEQNAKK